MKDLLHDHSFILMEAAVSEPLRRAEHFALHPELSVSPLIYEREGRAELKRLYQEYLAVAKEAGLPFVMCTPTWRASHERVHRAGVNPGINADAVRFMKELRETSGMDHAAVRIGGLMGCKNDSYKPEEALSAAAAEQFHAWQISELVEAGVDFLIAETLPHIGEAAGIAKAMQKTGVPYIISFVIDRNGRVLDDTALYDAVDGIDAATRQAPLGYMVNCSYPTFLCAADQPARLFSRLIGYQANASALDHCDLDECGRLQQEDVAEWGAEMLLLNQAYGVKLLGGCCGTGVEHLKYLVENGKDC